MITSASPPVRSLSELALNNEVDNLCEWLVVNKLSQIIAKIIASYNVVQVTPETDQ